MQATMGLVLCAAAMTLALAGSAQAEALPRQITVTGEGQIEAVPDMATLTLGVTNEAEEAEVAMAATSSAVAQMLDRLTGMGIAARDIQTQRLALNPVWSNRGGSTSGPAKITGFVASNMVMVRVRDLDALGPVLDGVISDGANDFNGLQFSVQDMDPLQDQARAAAVKDAIAAAGLLAEAAGVTLGPVVSIADHGGGGNGPMMMNMAAARDSSVPVAAGEITVSATVSMVFSIAD